MRACTDNALAIAPDLYFGSLTSGLVRGCSRLGWLLTLTLSIVIITYDLLTSIFSIVIITFALSTVTFSLVFITYVLLTVFFLL